MVLCVGCNFKHVFGIRNAHPLLSPVHVSLTHLPPSVSNCAARKVACRMIQIPFLLLACICVTGFCGNCKTVLHTCTPCVQRRRDVDRSVLVHGLELKLRGDQQKNMFLVFQHFFAM